MLVATDFSTIGSGCGGRINRMMIAAEAFDRLAEEGDFKKGGFL
jgi:hypothetical protein